MPRARSGAVARSQGRSWTPAHSPTPPSLPGRGLVPQQHLLQGSPCSKASLCPRPTSSRTFPAASSGKSWEALG